MIKAFLEVAALILISAPVSAASAEEAELYLRSNAEGGRALAIGDIAAIEGPWDIEEKIRHITIPESLTSDMYVDRKELGLLLKRNGIDNFFIHGSAVKINGKAAAAKVRRGEIVRVILRRKNIVLSMSGKAMNNASEGEQLKVKSGRRSFNGVLMQDKTVEAEI